MNSFSGLLIQAAVLNNLLLAELLGIREIAACSQRKDAACILALAFVCVIGITVPINVATLRYLLTPLTLENLGLPFYAINTLIVVYGLLALLERYRHEQAALWRALIPLLLLNSLLIGATVTAQSANLSVPAAILWGTGAGMGVGVIWLIFAHMQGRVQMQQVPAPLRGLPITLLTLAILSMVGFAFARVLQ